VAEDRGAQIMGSSSLRRLRFLRWLLIFVGCQYGTCFILIFWVLEVEVALHF